MSRAKGIDWDTQPLGIMSDGKIARMLGVNRRSVFTARVRRGIPVCLEHRGSKPLKIDWDAQPLGQVPDLALARTLGCAVSTVAHQRRQRGIDLRRGVAGPRGIVWEDQPLGLLSDTEISERVGCNRSSVQVARIKRGIPAAPRWARVIEKDGGVNGTQEGH